MSDKGRTGCNDMVRGDDKPMPMKENYGATGTDMEKGYHSVSGGKMPTPGMDYPGENPGSVNGGFLGRPKGSER